MISIDYCNANMIEIINSDIELEIFEGKIGFLSCNNTKLNKLRLHNVDLTKFQSKDSIFSELSFATLKQ